MSAAARVDEVEKRLAEQSLAVQRAEASAAAEATRVVGRIDVLEQSTTAKLRDATELGQALRAQVAEVQAHVAKLDAANRLVSALQAQVTTLQARVAELERRPKLSGSGSSRPATCDEMEARIEALGEFRRKGHGSSLARAAGYSCVEAKAVGYSLQEAKAAGWAFEELRMAGYIGAKGMTSHDFLDRHQAGCSNFAGLDFSGEDFSNMVLLKCNLSGCVLEGATFDGAQLTSVDLSNARLTGLACSSWRGARFSGECNFTGTNIRKLLSAAELKAGGLVSGLKTTGYSCSEAKAAGYTPSECHIGGFSFEEGRGAGFKHNASYWDRVKSWG
ncbi:hypothetical protein EMIHUDRAFT_255916 [Emiliania huxleyi CCMP1516]|uniref:Pentapeptide repeat-containing protein n=2 Tax=Emiliania huxleyi TaxID=2903 RepID=A0A0D3J1Z3_EMIH1|nr:hypothetical protein EMIHUDRAFT_255916 [Emiliania huxleyi CCMP1516]EOD17528.1 hypothetical protein EMIHUDRAFT_255916 [Emiliania huxleyi CCMP1516]|eukprot:XP_005769957.1 hypothetical protein EMIHUDRAFT_255916 [Emiliania huxleyi CCMP1516]